MNATKTQRKRNKRNGERSRLSWMAQVRRDSQTMFCIASIAEAAQSYAETVYKEHPVSAAARLETAFREIAAILPDNYIEKEALCLKSTR